MMCHDSKRPDRVTGCTADRLRGKQQSIMDGTKGCGSVTAAAEVYNGVIGHKFTELHMNDVEATL